MKVLPVLCALLSFSGAAESATRYVNPSHHNSRDSGSGASTAPYKTIKYAMRQLVSGDRLIIAPGTYRESLNPNWRAQNLVIEGSPGTMIKGSDIVTGWVSAGGGLFVRTNWTVNSQQVHVNGVGYQQIGGTITPKILPTWWPGRIAGGVSSMTPNSFYYDIGGRRLYIKPADGTLNGKTVEVSVRERLGIGTELNNIQFKNLSFMHSNLSATNRGGSLHYVGSRLVLDNISVTRTDSTGIALDGDHNVLSNSVSNYNGQTGVLARGRYVKLLNNETSYNNTRGFWAYWEAGGAKFMGPAGTSPSGLMDSVISGHKALYNKGTGLWMDTQPGGGNKILNSVVAYNQNYGIHFEKSQGVQIYNNLVYGNKQRGIYVATGSNTLVAHNLVVNNGWEGIIVHNDRRTLPGPKNNQVIGNLVGWNGGKCLFMGDPASNNKANGNLYLGNSSCKFAVERGLTYASATGLPQWNSVSGQDKSSWEKIGSLGAVSVSTLSAQQANVNWSSLKSLASAYRSPPTPLDSGLPPGPLSYNFAGITTTASLAPAETIQESPAATTTPVAVTTAPPPTAPSNSSTGSTAINTPQTEKPTIVAGIPAALPIPATRPSPPPASAVRPQDIRSLSCSSGHKLYVSLGGTQFREYLYELAARTEFRAYRSALEQCARSF